MLLNDFLWFKSSSANHKNLSKTRSFSEFILTHSQTAKVNPPCLCLSLRARHYAGGFIEWSQLEGLWAERVEHETWQQRNEAYFSSVKDLQDYDNEFIRHLTVKMTTQTKNVFIKSHRCVYIFSKDSINIALVMIHFVCFFVTLNGPSDTLWFVAHVCFSN